MNHYLGFDGGGTKTSCVILDAEGRVIAQGLAGPSNPLRVGFAQAFAALVAAGEQALSSAQLEKRHLRAICAGLAGAGRPNVAQRVVSLLAGAFPDCRARVTTDLEVALEAAAGTDPGVVLIAGTGSAAIGRNAAGQTARAGGYGPWIGDDGSAFEIGRRAAAEVARGRDLLAPETLVAEKILPALACATWDELTERIAENSDEVFPRIFPVVVEAANAGDSVARGILSTAATELADIATTVIRQLDLTYQEFVLAKSGGVFGRSWLLDAMLDATLAKVAPRAKIGPLSVSPAVGAARLAKRLAEPQRGGTAGSAPAHDTQG